MANTHTQRNNYYLPRKKHESREASKGVIDSSSIMKIIYQDNIGQKHGTIVYLGNYRWLFKARRNIGWMQGTDTYLWKGNLWLDCAGPCV
jgi:hypothetical protein